MPIESRRDQAEEDGMHIIRDLFHYLKTLGRVERNALKITDHEINDYHGIETREAILLEGARL